MPPPTFKTVAPFLHSEKNATSPSSVNQCLKRNTLLSAVQCVAKGLQRIFLYRKQVKHTKMKQIATYFLRLIVFARAANWTAVLLNTSQAAYRSSAMCTTKLKYDRLSAARRNVTFCFVSSYHVRSRDDEFVYYAVLPQQAALRITRRPSACSSVHSRASRSLENGTSQNIQTFMRNYPREVQLTEQLWGQKVIHQGHWGREVKIVFLARIFASCVDCKTVSYLCAQLAHLCVDSTLCRCVIYLNST